MDTAAAGEVVGQGVVVPALEGDAAGVETFVFDGYDLLFAFLADDDTGVSPGEVVLVPEGVYWEDEGVDRESQEIYDHPSDVLPLSFEDENKSLETIGACYHDDRDQGKLTLIGGDVVNEESEISASGRQDDGSEKIDKDDESHTETTESAQFLKPNQFS